MRRIQQPGPAATVRYQVAPCRVTHKTVHLPSGVDLLQAMELACSTHGATSAVARISHGAFDPLVYVMPALSHTPQHAAYYSEKHAPTGVIQLDSAAITMGRHNKQPWLHCHGIWRNADGQTAAGHILPNETYISQALSAELTFVHGADFEVLPCTETGFSLFHPVSHAPPPKTKTHTVRFY